MEMRRQLECEVLNQHFLLRKWSNRMENHFLPVTEVLFRPENTLPSQCVQKKNKRKEIIQDWKDMNNPTVRLH